MSSSIPLLILLSFLIVSHLALTSVRLECLQNEQGTELADTTWRLDYLDTASFQGQEAKQWVYENKNCPLSKFDTQTFCRKVLGCGKKILLVGDSTMYSWMLTIPHIVPSKTSSRECPTPNGCTRENRHCEHKARFKVLTHDICIKECRRSPTFITYVRHDFLMQAHGEKYLHSSVCEHWMQISRQYDYVVVTIGPHVSHMVDHPYSQNQSAVNITALLVDTSTYIATRLTQKLLKPSAKLIFRTGSSGVVNWSSNCPDPSYNTAADNSSPCPPLATSRTERGDATCCTHMGSGEATSNPAARDTASRTCSDMGLVPNSTAPTFEVFKRFQWDKIPLLNEIYAQTFQKYIPPEQFLIMNTTRLLMKIPFCRLDWLHFNPRPRSAKQTPVLLEWQIFYNILEELRRLENRQS